MWRRKTLYRSLSKYSGCNPLLPSFMMLVPSLRFSTVVSSHYLHSFLLSQSLTNSTCDELTDPWARHRKSFAELLQVFYIKFKFPRCRLGLSSFLLFFLSFLLFILRTWKAKWMAKCNAIRILAQNAKSKKKKNSLNILSDALSVPPSSHLNGINNYRLRLNNLFKHPLLYTFFHPYSPPTITRWFHRSESSDTSSSTEFYHKEASLYIPFSISDNCTFLDPLQCPWARIHEFPQHALQK